MPNTLIEPEIKKNIKQELKLSEFSKNCNNNGLKLKTDFVIKQVSALLTKGFLILTGLSGSGKTKFAQAFSQWISENNYQTIVVPVGADWTNREPLLGYPNALKYEEYIKPDNGVLDLIIEASKSGNEDIPFFLILDEMNLSHVERYFADFLSAIESSESIPLHNGGGDWDAIPSEIRIPDNLFIIGTVNIDETTYMFSPKVLDRANVIEFRIDEKDMHEFLNHPVRPELDDLKGAGSTMAADFVSIARNTAPDYPGNDKLNDILNKFFIELKKTGAEFGYRTASEIHRFASIIHMLTEREGQPWDVDSIADAAVMQKLLPKLHGSRRKLEKILIKLAELCLIDKKDIETYLDFKTEPEFEHKAKVRFPVSLEKIYRMYKRLVEDGFTSFAEA